VDPERQAAIQLVCTKIGTEKLTPLKEALPPDFTFDEIRLVLTYLRTREAGTSAAAAAS